MQRFFTLLGLLLLLSPAVWAQNTAFVQGKVVGDDLTPLSPANVMLEGTSFGTSTDDAGNFRLSGVPAGAYQVSVSMVGYKPQSRAVVLEAGQTAVLTFELAATNAVLAEVEVFGVPDKQPEKLATITRLPLKPSDQIQSISVISDRLIELQGDLTISEAARNVPGVYTFATYGNQRESMSSRGYRGIPILKNGVRVNSDFRGIGVLTDMQGIESVQVLKGAAAITQGIATDLGSPGGVINLVTKTPKFEAGGAAALRVGSFGQLRPAFDVYGPLSESNKIAFRLNGAYERTNSYRVGVSLEKFYINPSLEWRPDDKTSIILEMDYLDDSRTPDPGTINLSTNDVNAIYDLPYDKFLGFSSNRVTTRNATYSLRFLRQLSSQLSLRAAYIRSDLDVEGITTGLSAGGRGLPNLETLSQRYRTIGGSSRLDNNSVLQVDLIGQEIRTGALKHTFQVGVDFRNNYLETGGSSMASGTYVDIVDVFEPIPNTLPDQGYVYIAPQRDENGNIVTPGRTEVAPISLSANTTVSSRNTSYGLMAQDVVTLTPWARAFLGLRYSTQQSTGSATETEISRGDALNPQLGVMLTPKKGLNVFASYTSSTSLRGADNVDVNGNELGDQRIDQLEAGIKSDWFNNRLRFNLTLFKINNTNMSLPVYDANWNATGYYQKGGNDERKGVEVELIGRVLPNLELVAGYAHIDAQYKEHTSYYEGSAPLNTPRHTANFWAHYTLLKGFNIGVGTYYIGKRPVNDWATTVTHQGIVPNQKPFDVKAYTVVNAQLGYMYKQFGVRVLFNNLFDKIGYNAYRTSFINQTDPRNFAAIVSYKF
ncbi:iron complex outermembrane recepter protein [Catalinimonas alkaloidigena]|uniref:Iron complex outermembrane recepter protein n=1 Tax=Catalinimonas alkaloidigena TaxID=1075417 RepID=A0A1G9IPX1_9BACT|nr:TonB-dependent receptor [Catalinimonas alkaloidigena]SDL27210.1 iron complex outermembrane recepter protein [Catalinimonas alkaloidigena]